MNATLVRYFLAAFTVIMALWVICNAPEMPAERVVFVEKPSHRVKYHAISEGYTIPFDQLQINSREMREMFEIDQELSSDNSSYDSRVNLLRVWPTRHGDISAITCWGRPSLTARSFSTGGLRNDMILIPRVGWIRTQDFAEKLLHVLELEDTTYLICGHTI